MRQMAVGRIRGLAIGALVAALFAAAEARGHFLYIRVGPQAEAGRWADVYFSDRLEPGDPRFIARIAGTRLWVQARPGEFHEVPVHAVADRLRSPLPTDRSFVVIGQCEYGVVARPREKAFLLRHYPKAVVGVAEEVNRMRPRARSRSRSRRRSRAARSRPGPRRVTVPPRCRPFRGRPPGRPAGWPAGAGCRLHGARPRHERTERHRGCGRHGILVAAGTRTLRDRGPRDHPSVRHPGRQGLRRDPRIRQPVLRLAARGPRGR